MFFNLKASIDAQLALAIMVALLVMPSYVLSQQISTPSPAASAAQTAATVTAQTGTNWVDASAPTANNGASLGPLPSTNFPSTYNPAPAAPSVGQQSGTNGAVGQPAGAQVIPPPPLVNQALNLVSPLTPDEIERLHADFDQTRQAKSDPVVTPIPRISSISVDLTPGGAPPVVHAMRDQMTSLVFLDSTGAPWPLGATPRLANAGTFDVHWLKGTSAVVITATSAYESTGMAVFLEGLDTPIMIEISSGEPESKAKTRVVDYRLDLRVPGRGPNAKSAIGGSSRVGLYDTVLQTFLDGIPADGAKAVHASNYTPPHTEVWQYGDSLYVRTPLEMRSAFNETMMSADGMHVYQIDPTPLVTLSDGGENIAISLNLD